MWRDFYDRRCTQYGLGLLLAVAVAVGIGPVCRDNPFNADGTPGYIGVTAPKDETTIRAIGR